MGEKCGCLEQGRGKLDGHVGCTEVDRALEALGVNPKDANLCTKAAIMRGHIKITGQAGDLEQEIIKEKGECGHTIIATLGDLLKKTDLAGLDSGEDCGNATVSCKECNYERTCVVTVCEGNFSFESKFDPGKLHIHCRQCPGFGQCNGDHREAHCSRCGGIGCGKHYFRGMTGFSCDNCSKSKRQRQSRPVGDMVDHSDGEPTRKKVKLTLRFAIAEAAILDKLVPIKRRGKQGRKRAEKCVSLAQELDNSGKKKTGRNDSEGGSGAVETEKGSRNSNGKGSVGRKKGLSCLDKEGERKGKNRLSSMEDKQIGVPNLQQGVEVPNWREDHDHNVKCVSNKTSPESQEEPTDDASYLKRHNKHEKKEKQMKRWDDQRMRREQQVQKLRAKQEKKSLKQSKSDSKCQCTSLLPALEAVTAICVQETIPVSIFGRPLPDTGAKDFSLPWL